MDLGFFIGLDLSLEIKIQSLHLRQGTDFGLRNGKIIRGKEGEYIWGNKGNIDLG